MNVDKVIRDGNVAVLVSPGFGAGWSTWAGDKKTWALFSPEVVAWVEDGKPGGEEAIQKIVSTRFGESGFYCGGASDLEIEWVPQGTAFKLDEYDGSETLVVSGDVDWVTA